MNHKKIFYFISLLLAITFFIVSEGWTQPQSKPEIKPPIIIQSYVPEKGRYGDVLKFYIEAESQNEDMYRIATLVEQPGVGRYPTDFIMIKKPYRKHLKGYIQWNTFSSRGGSLPEWTQITVKISVFDKAGNESKEVVFPFEFVSTAKQTTKPPAPFDQKDIPKLGNVMIDLINPGRDGGRDRDNDLDK